MATSVVRQSFQQPPQVQTQPHISLAEILSALSFALDFTEGAMPGHALRTCLLGMRLAHESGLSPEQMVTLYYALLLKDIGCGSQATNLCGVLSGRDAVRPAGNAGLRRTPASTPALPMLGEGGDPGAKNARRRTTGLRSRSEAPATARFEKSAQILRKLDLEGNIAAAVASLNERWDGGGHPQGQAGEHIPLHARIISIAQHLDVVATRQGPVEAIEAVRENRGHWFDPKLVWIADWLHRKGSLWDGALPENPDATTRDIVLDLVPLNIDRLEAVDIDLICEAFAEVVDAKSSFTYRHSQSVTGVARAIAQQLGLADERVRLVHRAALLHDIGKLRIPNSILDKPGRLDTAEWSIVHEHPRLTREILSHIAAFDELAMIAGAHHERLDGTGYPDHLESDQIPLEARIIAVADVYDALTESRPYRRAVSYREAMEVIRRQSPHRLDGECCEALAKVLSERPLCTVQ